MPDERRDSAAPGAGSDPTPRATAVTTALEDQLRHELAPHMEVLRLLGRGSMASVFLAREVALRRLVAIKVLAPALARDQVTRLRFEREAQTAASISHPNVAAVYRVDRLASDIPFLVMEYVRGRSLANLLRSGHLFDAGEARRIIGDIASALAAAHRRGIVHRDVRPDNVLIEDDTGRVILLDFGLAGILESGDVVPASLTRVGDILGDPRYVPPEVLDGQRATGMADVYSLGVVAFELVTRRRPADVVGITGEAPRVSALCPGTDPGLDGLIHTCLAPLPDDRPSAADVAARIQALPPAAAPADPPAVPDAVPRRNAADLLRLPFVGELKRRRVFQVAVLYLLYAWLVIQVAGSVLPPLNMPDWTVTFVVVFVICGFPIALILGWMFDITPEGVRRTRRR